MRWITGFVCAGLMVGCVGGTGDEPSDEVPDTDTDAAAETDGETEDSETDGTTDTDEGPVDLNPQDLVACPALEDLGENVLCADIEGYGVALFDIWQARANVIDSRTDEADGQQEYLGLQIGGAPNGTLYPGTYTCGEFPGFVHLAISITSSSSDQWRAGQDGGTCTQTFTASPPDIKGDIQGSFSGTLERIRGEGPPATRTVTGVFHRHGELAEAHTAD